MRFYFLLSLGLFVTTSSFAMNQPDGYWRGAVTRDGAMQTLEVYFYRQADSLRATYNLPDLGLFEEPLAISRLTDTSFTAQLFMGSFSCHRNSRYEEITGTNNNWKPVGLKLHLKKLFTPPATYRKKEVAVPSGTTTLKGTLYQPVSGTRHPLVIIAHGADKPHRGNWVYRYYAYLLTGYGYAVYLFDQRGHGASGGSRDASLFEHADDLLAIGRHFSTDPSVNGKRMAVLGESRGGWVAPIAASRSSLFRTIVLAAGPALGPVALEPEVVKATLTDQGFSQPQIDSALAYTALYFGTVRNGQRWTELAEHWKMIKARPWAEVLQQTTAPDDEGLRWWRSNNLDPKGFLTKVKASALAIFGSQDLMVPPASNEPLMRQYMAQSGKKHSVVTIENLPHGIYHYSTLYSGAFSWPTGYWIWPKRSVMMDETVVGWLKENL